jgi:hypothetical protein
VFYTLIDRTDFFMTSLNDVKFHISMEATRIFYSELALKITRIFGINDYKNKIFTNQHQNREIIGQEKVQK